eukprot:1679035-Rhodomonas_salina.1
MWRGVWPCARASRARVSLSQHVSTYMGTTSTYGGGYVNLQDTTSTYDGGNVNVQGCPWR